MATQNSLSLSCLINVSSVSFQIYAYFTCHISLVSQVKIYSQFSGGGLNKAVEIMEKCKWFLKLRYWVNHPLSDIGCVLVNTIWRLAIIILYCMFFNTIIYGESPPPPSSLTTACNNAIPMWRSKHVQTSNFRSFGATILQYIPIRENINTTFTFCLFPHTAYLYQINILQEDCLSLPSTQ
jgi:hypothetical protein